MVHEQLIKDPMAMHGYLCEAMDENFSLILWQDRGGEKHYFNGQLVNVSSNRLFIKIIPIKSNEEIIDINKSSPFHCSLTGFYQSLHIKFEILYINTDVAIVSFPNSIKSFEKRCTPIPYYESPQHNLIQYSFDDYQFIGTLLKLKHDKVIFYTDKEDILMMNLLQSISVDYIAEQIAPFPLRGVIEYMAPFHLRSPNDNIKMRIGVKFKTALDHIKILPFAKIYNEERFGLDELTKKGEKEIREDHYKDYF